MLMMVGGPPHANRGGGGEAGGGEPPPRRQERPQAAGSFGDHLQIGIGHEILVLQILDQRRAR